MVKDAKLQPQTPLSSPESSRQPPSEKPADSYWPKIASKDEIPTWLRDNDYIINGHPMPTNSYSKSFRLWRCLHMETMNIWTHFLGSAFFVATGLVLYKYFQRPASRATLGDVGAFGVSLAAAVSCFTLSATFHTLRSHSYRVHHFWGKMDIMGICLLALGGGASATYYAFYGHNRLQNIYWALDACSAAAAGVTLFDTGGGGSKMRSLRGGVFTMLAVSAMLPILHSSYVHGWNGACQRIGVQYFLAEAVSLLLGVCAFVGRFPERLKPGMFDIWGHSHQIFHTCAVIATGFHVAALGVGYQYLHGMK